MKKYNVERDEISFNDIIYIKKQKIKKYTYKQFFDLEIEGNNNYFANDILVHNSATPEREDGTSIMIDAYLGKIIYTKTPSELIKAGYLAKPYIYFIDCENDFNPKVSYAGLYKHLVSFKKRNDIAARCAYEFAKMGKTTLISIVRVNHAEEILKSLKEIDDVGFNIKIITGKDSSDEKIQTIKKMNNGQYPIVISTLFGEGVDVPELSAIINVRATKSIVDLKQQTGRTLRLKKNKENPIVIDFYDYSNRVIDYNKSLLPNERKVKDYFKSYANKKMKSLKTEPEFELKQVVDVDEMLNDVKSRES
jgi:superfamily II DNA or RNA helicase